MAAKKKTIWLLTILLLYGVSFAEAQQAVKMPASVKLHWEDTSENEKGFRIYRIMPKGKIKMAEVSANVTTYTDKRPASKACYTVTAFNSAGESPPSNVACIDNASATKGER
jgi:hypothetical protein